MDENRIPRLQRAFGCAAKGVPADLQCAPLSNMKSLLCVRPPAVREDLIPEAVPIHLER